MALRKIQAFQNVQIGRVRCGVFDFLSGHSAADIFRRHQFIEVAPATLTVYHDISVGINGRP
jgi:hypothetical protein